MEKIKLSEITQIAFYKEILDSQISQLTNELTPSEIYSTLSKYATSDEAKNNLKIIIDNFSIETLEKIAKRIKNSVKHTMKFIATIVEEEATVKDTGIQIIKDKKDEQLEKKVHEKVDGLKSLIEKISQRKKELDNSNTEKIDNLFNELKIPPKSFDTKIMITKINKKSDSNELLTVDFIDLVQLFISQKEENSKKILEDVVRYYDSINKLEGLLFDEYKELEKGLFEDKINYEVLVTSKNSKEQFLIDNNVLF